MSVNRLKAYWRENREVLARELRRLCGCTMCARRFRFLSECHWVPIDKFEPAVDSGGEKNWTLGSVHTIHVPVCRVCYPTLTTSEGILRLTQAVNG